jgi:long-chain acyl-CoA synthetase
LSGGEDIYPVELETIMYGLEEIAEAVVSGVPEAVYGENVVALS